MNKIYNQNRDANSSSRSSGIDVCQAILVNQPHDDYNDVKTHQQQ